MKISQSMQQLINKQINAELYSAYLYLAMSAYFEAENLSGFAAWMKVQAKEETGHAMKFFDYIFERDGEVSLAAIDQPQAKWASPLAAFQDAYAHEEKVTSLINDLYEMAESEKDPATKVLLHWFIDEQVEEEDSALSIVQKLEMIGDSKNGLIMLDHELGKRGQ